MQIKKEVNIQELKRLDIVGIKEDEEIIYGIIEYDAELIKANDEDGDFEYWDCDLIRFEGVDSVNFDENSTIFLVGKASEKKFERARIVSRARFLDKLAVWSFDRELNNAN